MRARPEILLGRVYEEGTARREALDKLKRDINRMSSKSGGGPKLEQSLEALDKFERGDISLAWQVMDLHHHGKTSLREAVLNAWALRLTIHGRKLDDQLDVLLSKVIVEPFGWRTSTEPLKGDLDSILRRREDVRAYERDVEQFLESVNEARGKAAPDVLPVTALLDQLQRTFDRSYDLCTFKLSNIATMRVSLASILVAIVALIIALLD